MNEYEPTSPYEALPSTSSAKEARSPRVWRALSSRLSGWIVAAALMCAVIALSVALGTSTSTTAGAGAPGHGFGGGAGQSGGSNARSGPAAGGSTGTVNSLSTLSFTLTTSAGQTVTVNEASSTTYEKGTSSTSASAVTTGEPVLVLGTTSGTTIAATQVIVQPADSGSANSAAQVVPFQRGAPSTVKQVGQVPVNYTEGSGTIVSGTTANQATEAALAAYPGGVVDRVVQLSNGEYEVHYIGVNWPHHIFVNQNFQVVGAD
jgi:hypothetical protein